MQVCCGITQMVKCSSKNVCTQVIDIFWGTQFYLCLYAGVIARGITQFSGRSYILFEFPIPFHPHPPNDNFWPVSNSARSCCLSCSPRPVDLMEDQQLYNLNGPLDQQHFTVTTLQYKNSLHFSIIYHVFYKFILWRTIHFLGEPTVFLTYWSLDQAVILVKVEHWSLRRVRKHITKTADIRSTSLQTYCTLYIYCAHNLLVSLLDYVEHHDGCSVDDTKQSQGTHDHKHRYRDALQLAFLIDMAWP